MAKCVLKLPSTVEIGALIRKSATLSRGQSRMIPRVFDRDDAAELLRRKPLDGIPIITALWARTPATIGQDLAPDAVVRRITRNVRDREEAALIECARRL